MDVNLDAEKLFIGGHSLGGWTSILSTVGEQPYFKVSLSFDPSHMQHQKEINEDAYTMKRPTCIIHSSSFLTQMCLSGFGWKTGRQEYKKYLQRFA